MNMKNNIILAIMAVVLAAAAIFILIPKKENAKTEEVKKVKVVATLFPLYDMIKEIAGERAELTLLLPPGTEAHSFELAPSDMIKISESDIFAYAGKLMEPWAEEAIKSFPQEKFLAVDSSQGAKIIKAGGENSSAGDPHIWLDFSNAAAMAENIAKALIEKDPNGQEFYRQNLEKYKKELSLLDSEYQNGLADCQSREIIYGGHYAFGYLAARYNLKYSAAQGFSPDAEPSAKDLSRLIEQIKKEKIKYIFYEELSSPKIAETIAAETKTKLLLLNAGHNLAKKDFAAGLTFFQILRNNLANLKIGLECN